MIERPVAVLALVCSALLAGCRSGADHLTGIVTTTTPRLCIGAADAAGECFLGDPSLVSNLRLDDCVVVTYRPSTDPAPGPRGTATSVEPSADC